MSQSTQLVPPANFFGGFLCGVIGILAFAWFGCIAMLVFGSLGFIIGCWPGQVLGIICAAPASCIAFFKTSAKGFQIDVEEIKNNAFVHGIIWLYKSKYGRLYCARHVVVFSVIVLWLFCTVPYWPGLYGPDETNLSLLQAFVVVALMVVNLCVLATFVFSSLLSWATMMSTEDLLSEPEDNDRETAVYLKSMFRRKEQRGLLFCVGYDIWNTVLRLLIITIACYFGVAVGILLGAVLAIVALVTLIVRGILLVTDSDNGVISLAVALTVTACSAWTFDAHLSGVWLYVIALATGCVAGGAVVGTQKLLTGDSKVAVRIHKFAKSSSFSKIKPLAIYIWYKPEKAAWEFALARPEPIS